MPAVSAPSSQSRYKRGYVACLPCRAHKVRCVLETDPPCAKCRWEHRECVFERPQRQRRRRDPPRWTAELPHSSEPPTGVGDSEPSAASLLATLVPDTTESPGPQTGTASAPASASNTLPLLDHLNNSRPSLLERSMFSDTTRPGDDSLDLLSDDSTLFPKSPANGSVTRSSKHPSYPLPSPPPDSVQSKACLNPAHLLTVVTLSHGEQETLNLWNRNPFVRLGWFTAQEVLTYLDLFHIHLAPFRPTLMLEEPGDQSPRYRLIASEPMLCTTILMIASHFFTLPGPGGASRSYVIHDRLWRQCENLIQQLMYGQEKYVRRNRTLGTIQSLLLLSGWHPRSSHFSSQTDLWETMDLLGPQINPREGQTKPALTQWQQDLFDRAKQSNRMSWMLIGAAANLAYEIGVFMDNQGSDTLDERESITRVRTRKLLYAYVTNLAVKMGMQNVHPQDIILSVSMLRPGEPGGLGDVKWDLAMELWLGLIRLGRTASAMFFHATADTKKQLDNGNYIILLQNFESTLSKWHDDFLATVSEIEEDLGNLLSIEYHNLRVYTHALSIQAVLERARAQNLTHFKRDRVQLSTTCFLPQDILFIREVTLGSNTILQTAISMADKKRLRFIPIRQLYCILSAFIFLFKAINIGISGEDVRLSVDNLERCVKALRASGMDEMDISQNTMALLESYARKVREDADSLHPPSEGPPRGQEQTGGNGEGLPNATDASGLGTSSSAHPLPVGISDEWNSHTFSIFDLATDAAMGWPRPSGAFSPSDPISAGFLSESVDFLW